MIGTYEIENRVYDFFDTVFGNDKVSFKFENAASAAFIVDRYTDVPRPAASTLLFYRVDSIETFGSTVSIDDVIIDRATKDEYVNMCRRVHVIVNILSKYKGDAKDALNFVIVAAQTTRGYEACYPSPAASSFDFALYNIDPNFKDLTELENRAWTERVEADFYFNYNDTLSFGIQPLISAPSSVELTKTKVDYDLELK